MTASSPFSCSDSTSPGVNSSATKRRHRALVGADTPPAHLVPVRHEIAITRACERHVGMLLQETKDLARDHRGALPPASSQDVITRILVGHDFADTIVANMFGNRRVPGVVTIAAIAVAIGLLPLPYGYYMLLRLFLCVLSIYFLSSVHGVRDWREVGPRRVGPALQPYRTSGTWQQTAVEPRQRRDCGVVLDAQSTSDRFTPVMFYRRRGRLDMASSHVLHPEPIP